MYDKELAIEILHQIENAAQKVIQRFQVINKPDDFTDAAAVKENLPPHSLVPANKPASLEQASELNIGKIS